MTDYAKHMTYLPYRKPEEDTKDTKMSNLLDERISIGRGTYDRRQTTIREILTEALQDEELGKLLDQYLLNMLAPAAADAFPTRLLCWKVFDNEGTACNLKKDHEGSCSNNMKEDYIPDVSICEEDKP